MLKKHVVLIVLAAALCFVTDGVVFGQGRMRRGMMPGGIVAAPARPPTDDDNDPADGRFPGGAALKTDPEQQRLLTRAQQCVEDGRLDLAAVLWQKVLDESGDTLISRDGRIYTSLVEEVERTIAKLPPEALETYRVSADGEAQAVLAAASPGAEEDALAIVVRRFFLSSHGDDAAYTLACIALDRHDFVGASHLLNRILQRHPDPSIPPAELLLRLAVASARMNDRPTAEASLARIAQAPGARPPSAIIDLVRQDVLQTASMAAAEPAGKNWHTLLGNSSRTGHMAGLPPAATNRTLSELWTQEYPLAMSGGPAHPYGGMMMGPILAFSGELPPQQQQTTAISREDLVGEWLKNGWMPTGQLLFHEGRVFIKTPDRLVCYSAAAHDDKPLWRSLWRNQYSLDGMSQSLAMMAMSYGAMMPTGGRPKTTAEVMLFGDRVHQSMSISGDTVYTLEGKAISDQAASGSAGPERGFQWGVMPRRTRSNWLTAYSVAGGKARWTRTASDEDKDGNTEVGFLAAPVPCGNLLLAPVTDGGTIWLFGLAPETGKTVWKAYLCDEPQGGANPWSPVAIAVDGREAYLTCGCGVVFAIDGVSGSIRWAMRYERTGTPNNWMRNVYGQGQTTLIDPNGWDDDLVIPYGRALVIMASDCNKLMAIDRRTCELLWESPNDTEPSTTYCLGVHGRSLYLGGKNVVRRYDLLSGRLVREKEIGDSYGRGCVTADAVYVPVRDSIVKFDIELNRELVQVGVALTSDDPVGNLFSDGEKLWVVGAGRVYAMTTLEHRLESLGQLVAAGDPAAQLNRMRLYARQRQMDKALSDLRGAYTLLLAQKTPDEAAKQLFAAIYELKLPTSQPVTTLTLLNEAFVAAPSQPALSKEMATRRAEVIISSLNAIRERKPRNVTTAILAIAPLLEEDHLLTSAAQALDAAATKNDNEPLQAALSSHNPVSQLVAMRAAARLAPETSRQSLEKLKASSDDRVRLAAARLLANAGDRKVLETFVALLSSDNSRVRARSHQALRSLTGQQITFYAEGKAEERNKTIEAWKKWLSAEGATAKLRLPLTDRSVPLGRILYVSQVESLLVELDADHKKRWETKLPGPSWGCQGLDNGHRLVAVYANNLVIEYDDEGKEVWRKDGLPGPPYSVQRLENGNTLVACADVQALVEIAPDGTMTNIQVQGRPTSAQRLESGNTLVALQQGNRVVEIDPAGKIVWEARSGNGPSHAVRLENGNTLITLLGSREVVEYDASGKTVLWRSKVPLLNPYCAQRLPTGTTLVADHQGVHELDESGQQIRWQQRQQGITGLSSF